MICARKCRVNLMRSGQFPLNVYCVKETKREKEGVVGIGDVINAKIRKNRYSTRAWVN